MNCECDFEKAGFGAYLFCKTCGMDMPLKPIIKKGRSTTQIYCCEGCTE